MHMLCLYETIYQIATANSMCWCGCDKERGWSCRENGISIEGESQREKMEGENQRKKMEGENQRKKMEG